MKNEKPTIGGIYQTNVIGGGDMWRRIKILKYPLPLHYQFHGINVHMSAIVDLIDQPSSPFIVELKNIKTI